MKLYYAPGACSLADHIALNAAGIPFELVKVDLKTRRTEDGRDYAAINPKGYVPALEFDDGELLTENVAILTWISDHDRRASGPVGGNLLERYRQLEMLAFIATELHKTFKPFFSPNADDAAKAAAGKAIGGRLTFIAGKMAGEYLFGAAPGVADDYLFVMLTWAKKNDVAIPATLAALMERMAARPEVRKALSEEGLTRTDAAA